MYIICVLFVLLRAKFVNKMAVKNNAGSSRKIVIITELLNRNRFVVVHAPVSPRHTALTQIVTFALRISL